ncbi:hypothetical protein [Bacillus suaedae]|uniref:Uncharacterized protein n=1 Tax=Halalkalibacter suaedae TaxID=2822140 RepID=A0A940WSC6_9BACI|nr:hypothetical protein [Bacillus suaedae]MBP3951829.1 hypothetical protein [Bacillus suaedae]
MNKFMIIMLMAILAGCSDQSTVYTPSIKLTSSNVRIVSDIPEQQPIVDGQLFEHIGLVSLQYDF